MSERTELTKKLARQLKSARNVKGLSQYELADALGWPRSKIKRIEKAEVQTIGVKDLKELRAVLFAAGVKKNELDVKEPVKTSAKKVKLPRLFRTIERLDRKMGDHLIFFRVEMAVVAKPEELLEGIVMHKGVKGAIHGVENTVEQDPLKPGHVLDIAVWVGP